MNIREVDSFRLRRMNRLLPKWKGEYILYWMTSSRRLHWNFALQHAARLATLSQKPLLVLDILFCDYPYASDRHHRFLLDGIVEMERESRRLPFSYYPYVEKNAGEGIALLEGLSNRALEVVTDDFPTRYARDLLKRGVDRARCPVTTVDSNGLVPMVLFDRPFPTAYAFRRQLQKVLPPFLQELPAKDSLAQAPIPVRRINNFIIPSHPRFDPDDTSSVDEMIHRLPIDHSVPSVPLQGGERAARETLHTFMETKLDSYFDKRNEPEEAGTSGLSPYLHYGQISAHEILSTLTAREEWSIDRLSFSVSGKRTGWWGVSPPAEAFLDQLVTWRELGFNMCAHDSDYDRYDTLPPWAKQTLQEHEDDPRPYLYGMEEFEGGRTHDPLWNAAQGELVREGRMHNYLRMLWGKKILEWSASPRDALRTMFYLNDKYALDGSDPNSVSGIFWCLGRYDRPWGPERPIFGKVRYMSSVNTARKVRVKEYIRKYART